jgi:Fuc2NAc and GlcNAc transferase
MDGIDGIAGTEGVFFSASGAWFLAGFGQWDLVVLMLATAGACTGFLVLNWPPARIFLGDVGSAFLGFLLASLALLGSMRTGIPIAVWAILAGTFLVDASFTLLRRIVSGKKWWLAHRSHAYQGLSDRLGSHRAATVIYLFVNVVWLLPLAIMASMRDSGQWWIAGIALTPLGVACLFLYSDNAVSREH